jgi:hypothetical protein
VNGPIDDGIGASFGSSSGNPGAAGAGALVAENVKTKSKTPKIKAKSKPIVLSKSTKMVKLVRVARKGDAHFEMCFSMQTEAAAFLGQKAPYVSLAKKEGTSLRGQVSKIILFSSVAIHPHPHRRAEVPSAPHSPVTP